MKKFALIALLGLISFTEAIHLSEDPAPAGDAEPKEDAKAPAPPTEDEKKEAAKKVEDAKAEQEAIDKKAAKAAKKEDEAIKAEEYKKKTDYEKELHAIASTNHKESNAFDNMHKEKYNRDEDATQKTKDDKLIAKGIAPPNSLVNKEDDDLTEAQKTDKLAMIAEIAVNKKKVEAAEKSKEEKLARDGEDWTMSMPNKFLDGGPQPPKAEKMSAPVDKEEVKGALAPEAGAEPSPAAAEAAKEAAATSTAEV